jgi:hypothetical protein
MFHEIQLWFQSNQDYPSGIILFDRFCRNPNLARILRVGGATGKNRKTLAYELQKIVRISNTENQQIASESNKKVTGSVPENLVPPLPSAIGELRSKQKLTYKLLDNLHAVLPFRSKEERKTIAFQILDLDDQLSEINSQINHYEKRGVIPVQEAQESEKPVSAMSEAELIRRQNLVRTYVSRYKRLSVESASLKDRDHYARLLEKYTRELGEIDKHLLR